MPSKVSSPVLVIDKESFAEVEAILKKYTFNKPVAIMAERHATRQSPGWFCWLSPVSSGAAEPPVILDPTAVAARITRATCSS